jgi:hypothetical protein
VPERAFVRRFISVPRSTISFPSPTRAPSRSTPAARELRLHTNCSEVSQTCGAGGVNLRLADIHRIFLTVSILFWGEDVYPSEAYECVYSVRLYGDTDGC